MTHEDFSRKNTVQAGSNTSFGFTIAAVSLIVAFWPLLHGHPPRGWLVAIAVLFAAAAKWAPSALAPLNNAWFRLGLLLHTITNPVIMAALFYGVMTPIAAVFRLRGRDPLGLRYEPNASSYWAAHPAAEGNPSDMRKQF